MQVWLVLVRSMVVALIVDINKLHALSYLLPPQRHDALIYNQYCSAGYLLGYALYEHLLTQKDRKLVSPIADCSRQGETGFLTPLIDWKSVAEASDLSARKRSPVKCYPYLLKPGVDECQKDQAT